MPILTVTKLNPHSLYDVGLYSPVMRDNAYGICSMLKHVTTVWLGSAVLDYPWHDLSSRTCLPDNVM